jgi:hypothetical protein
MFENRIAHFFSQNDATLVATGMQAAFVVCPTSVMANFSAVQQSYIAEVYRRALELTQKQLQRPTRRINYEFSLN